MILQSEINTGFNYDQDYYKIISETMRNRGFKYVKGFNELKEEFNPSDDCDRGGLYFVDLDHIFRWLNLYKNGFIWKVRIPADAKVYQSQRHRKFKTNCMIISDPVSISEFLNKHVDSIMKLNQCADTLKYIDQTMIPVNICQEFCVRAVEQNSLVLKYVKDQTREMCIRAVEQNADMLEFVRDQTTDICIRAVRQHGLSLRYVKNQTSDICSEAIKQNCLALAYVRKQTPTLCIQAVKQNGLALKYVKNQTHEICIEAVKQNGLSLQYVIYQTHYICIQAVKQNGCSLQYVKYQTHEICMEAVKQNGLALDFVVNRGNTVYAKICEEAIEQNPLASLLVK